MLISWTNVMSTKNVEIKKNSKICDLQFTSEDIIKEDACFQKDETITF